MFRKIKRFLLRDRKIRVDEAIKECRREFLKRGLKQFI